MSKLYISEYASVAQNGKAQVPIEPPITTQVVDFSLGVQSSSSFNAQTNIVLIKTDADCHYSVGRSPTATTSHMALWNQESTYFALESGGMKVSVIAAS